MRRYDQFLFHKIDFRDLVTTQGIFQQYQFERICHLGARAGVRASVEDPLIYEATNIRGTLNLLELARQYSIRYFVLASTSSVYGGNTKLPFAETDPVDHPVSPYAATKKAAEISAYTYHHLYQIHCIILRFFTVYGPWGRPDMALFKFTQAILNDQPIQVYNFGKQRRDFTYIDDIVAGVVAALHSDYAYEIINLGNSNPEQLIDFITAIEQATGKTARQQLIEAQPGDVVETYADITKAKQLLKFQPTTNLVQGIEQFVRWYRDYYHV